VAPLPSGENIWSNLDVIQPGPYEVPGFLGIPAENQGIFWDLSRGKRAKPLSEPHQKKNGQLAAWNWFIHVYP
jgi:hypothetical protein